ncbi:MAG: cupin domain-containing protein [Planctomycetota bacterium]|jgi:mannose-6-phosphate isomerase-like protein (cupin superfamily)
MIILTLCSAGCLALAAHSFEDARDDSDPAGPDVRAMLDDFVADYRDDAMARPLTFGVDVRDAPQPRWHVIVEDEGDKGNSVTLHEGFPDTPIAYFETDVETLRRIHAGELASLTAMGKAFSTDFAPLDLETMEGFVPGPTTFPDLVAAAFHFWTRGFPERVKFGDLARTRRLHGGNGVLFYYQPGFRSGYFNIQPGDHVNADEASKTNPFPTLLIVTAGRTKARIGDVECELKAGETIFIGPGVVHEFWIDEDADHHAEGVLVMFGEGA